VVEHHSALDPAEETESNKLASENWDARLIVTTTVQFFESLFAKATSRCRKLHNVARSVILLDEVQSLPPAFLYPILDSLRQLSSPPYGCSVVLCTATQPALFRREALPLGLENVREIMREPDPVHLSRNLTRVNVEWPSSPGGDVTYVDIRDRIVNEKMARVLVVVHRRDDAREMAKLLPEEGRFHLSALMCPAHRLHVLDQIRIALKAEGKACRVVATQLVEAGVDLDFPVVFRALGGLDSLAQAAGRCNREGLAKEGGRMIVFVAPTKPPQGVPRRGLETTFAMLASSDRETVPRDEYGNLDLFNPEIFTTYFRQFYSTTSLDQKQIMTMRAEFKFESVAKAMQLIEDGHTRTLVVPYADAKGRLEAVRKAYVLKPDDLRTLQPYVVRTYEQDWRKLEDAGAIETIHDTVHCLTRPFEYLYDTKDYGLLIGEKVLPDPACLVS
jgi:CRISPR-associated endonuclease/helicase Cas3